MAPARRYQTYKYYYTTDFGQVIIRQQREFLDELGAPLLPVTPIFLSAVFTGQEKIVLFERNERHVLVEIPQPQNQTGTGKFKQYLPDPPGTEYLLEHVKQIRNSVENKFDFYCLDYYGESA